MNPPRCGIEAASEFFGDLITTLGARDSTIVNRLEAGDRVVVELRVQIHGSGSDITDSASFAIAYTFRQEKVVLFEYFLSYDEALDALELRG